MESFACYGTFISGWDRVEEEFGGSVGGMDCHRGKCTQREIEQARRRHCDSCLDSRLEFEIPGDGFTVIRLVI